MLEESVMSRYPTNVKSNMDGVFLDSNVQQVCDMLVGLVGTLNTYNQRCGLESHDLELSET